MIFDETGIFVYSISSEPNPIDVVGKQVIKTDDEFDFKNKRYALVNGEIISEDVVFIEPPPAPEPTIADKLAAAGISIDDLKVALGI